MVEDQPSRDRGERSPALVDQAPVEGRRSGQRVPIVAMALAEYLEAILVPGLSARGRRSHAGEIGRGKFNRAAVLFSCAGKDPDPSATSPRAADQGR